MREVREVTDALDRVAKTMTPRLRVAARTGGWPSEVVSTLRVERDENGILQAVHDGDPKEIETLEFGDHDNPPKPVLNNFFDNHMVKRTMSRETSKSMTGFVKYAERLFR